MKPRSFARALLIFALCLPACHPNKNAAEDPGIIRTQTEQIARLIELSNKQAEQIAQLTSTLEAEKKAAVELKNGAGNPAGQPSDASRFSITGSAYITRSGGNSTVLRDLRVMLLSNAQIRWSAYVKDGGLYSSDGLSDEKENRLRSDLTQFLANVNDLIAAYATTDAEGKYKFANVAPGDYYLFAQCSGSDSTICWFIPVSVQQGGTPLEVNLANSTAYAIAWRSAR